MGARWLGAMGCLLLFAVASQADITGFKNGTNWTINDSGGGDLAAFTAAEVLQITSNTNDERHGVWFNDPQKVTAFTASFTYQLDPASPVPNELLYQHGPADGMTFTIQNHADGPNSVGGGGGCMGFCGITTSAGVVGNVWGDHTRGTQLWQNGHTRFFNALCTTSGGIDLLSNNPIKVDLKYDGTTLTEVVTDTVTGVSLTFTYPLDVTASDPVSGNPIADPDGKAFVGFTGATGGAHALQKVTAFTYKEGP
jgi:hypothetical protein